VDAPCRVLEGPGAGHFLTDQAAEAVTKELLAHLARHAGA
jgi:hypothetical protein